MNKINNKINNKLQKTPRSTLLTGFLNNKQNLNHSGMKKLKKPRMRGNLKSALLLHKFAKISQLGIRTLLMH